MDKEISKLNFIINNSKNIVFLGGAGVSTESGIPDFRGKDGLYNQKYDYSPEYMLSIDCFLNDPELFYKFYFDKMIYDDVKPNIIHYKLADLEKRGILSSVITQNIDGLHQMAGSKNVLELHGNVYSFHCMKCNKKYNLQNINRSDIPKCSCGGILKPDIVLYGEMMDENVSRKAIYEVSKADTLIVGGTSLLVNTASSLLNYFNGDNLVIINLDKTPFDFRANIVIHEKLGNVLKKIK